MREINNQLKLDKQRKAHLKGIDSLECNSNFNIVTRMPRMNNKAIFGKFQRFRKTQENDFEIKSQISINDEEEKTSEIPPQRKFFFDNN